MNYTLTFFRKAIFFLFFIPLFAVISAQAQDDSLLAPKYTDTTYYYYIYDTVPRLVETETISPGKLPKIPATIPQGIMQPLAIHEHIPTSFEPDRSKNVGEIPIQSGVSATGAMNYMVPVQAAPGKATLPVSVSLAYSSQGGAGPAGFGWSIGGLSMIQEVSSGIYYNTKTEPLKFSKAGQFVLDGMKLVKLSENSTQIDYQSEQGNIKVTAYLSGNNIRYFNVFYPNGGGAIFGYESNTTQQLYYPLTRIVDIHENRIKYNYTLRNGQYYISKIEYGGTNTLPHYVSIEFTYATRTDVNTTYSAGQTFVKDWLLSTIVCKSLSTALRTYTFTYQYSNNTALLQKIDCSAGGGSLNPLQFYYGNGSTTAQLVKTTTQLTSWFSNITVPNLKVTKGKFDYGTDNDGLISYPNLNPYFEKYEEGNLFNHSKKEYINLFATNQTLLVYQGLQDAVALPPVSITSGTGFVNMFSADIDGKPGEEVIKINNRKNGNLDRVEFQVYKANLYSGLALTNTYTFDLGNLLEWFSTKSVHPKYFYSGDFNGDGKMEILAVSCHNPLGKTEYVSKTYIFDMGSGVKRHESTGLNFKIDYAVLSGVNDDILFPVDVDGDGKTDIIHIHDNGTDVYTFDISGTTYTRRLVASNINLKKADVKYRQLAIGDLNADGLADILISPRESYYYYTYVTLPVYAPRYCSNGHEGTYTYGSCNVCYVYMPESSYCYECYSYLNYQYNYSTGTWEYTCPNHGTTVTVTRSEYVDNGNTWSAFYCKGNGVLDKKTITFKNLEQNEKIILQDVNRDNITDVISNLSGSIKAYLVNNGAISTSYAAYAYVSG
ncbi:MAG TPA: FG-GAP-like repeat-containing protein, partial [Agriterribacter sp.]|nr:FG-GAP-like repeat-containing protein [Agriterribacter sp.]